MISNDPFTKRLQERESGMLSTEENEQSIESDLFEKRAESRKEDTTLESALRWLYQIPSGLAKRVTYPMDILQAMGTGAALDEEEIEQLEKIHARLGKEFNREEYEAKVAEASEMFPSQGNIERMIEEETGLPLTPKTKGQKILNLASTAGGFKSGNAASKAQAAVVAPAVSEVTQALGGTEELGEFLGIAGSTATPDLKRSQVKKPSGMVERGFESLKKPIEISEGKLGQINNILKEEFTQLSDKIIKDSPVGETAKNIANDPAFKLQTEQLFEQAQDIANSLAEKVKTKSLKKEMVDVGDKAKKGFMASEYDKSYNKFLKESLNELPKEDITAGQLVEQYRKNNGELKEYFEPGGSKAMNRAKRDILLDKNKAISSVMEKNFPESELVNIFKEGNERWSKIRDLETIDTFVDDVFKEKVNHKKAKEIFEDRNTQRIFKRALGEKGYKEFETLTKDLLQNENAYKMLKIAGQDGYEKLVRNAGAFIFHPKLGAAKMSLDGAKLTYRFLINASLQKPKMITNLKKGIKEIKLGDYKAATATFNSIQNEIDDYESNNESEKK